MQKQVKRIMSRYFELSSPIGKYAYVRCSRTHHSVFLPSSYPTAWRAHPSFLCVLWQMVALQDRNEVLFYRCLIDYLEELAPIIYTPTSVFLHRCSALQPSPRNCLTPCHAVFSVGLACQTFSSIFRRPRGMYFSAADRGVMQAMIWNWSHPRTLFRPSPIPLPSSHLLLFPVLPRPTSDVDIIVVTDGSRILGLGDLGTNGMGIPIGKLSLYTAGAGIHPGKTLPVMIDVGTNNEKLLNDPMYLGLPQRRVTGPEYFEILDEFIRAVVERFPGVLVQFEDFANDKASVLLEKYRNKLLCFNDDIQGTGCVVVAAVLGALRATGAEKPGEALKEQRIVVVGAGSAGLGVASFLKFAMQKEGLTENEASQRFWIVDKDGVIVGTQRTDSHGDGGR